MGESRWVRADHVRSIRGCVMHPARRTACRVVTPHQTLAPAAPAELGIPGDKKSCSWRSRTPCHLHGFLRPHSALRRATHRQSASRYTECKETIAVARFSPRRRWEECTGHLPRDRASRRQGRNPPGASRRETQGTGISSTTSNPSARMPHRDSTRDRSRFPRVDAHRHQHMHLARRRTAPDICCTTAICFGGSARCRY